jgi:hypothetical protein
LWRRYSRRTNSSRGLALHPSAGDSRGLGTAAPSRGRKSGRQWNRAPADNSQASSWRSISRGRMDSHVQVVCGRQRKWRPESSVLPNSRHAEFRKPRFVLRHWQLLHREQGTSRKESNCLGQKGKGLSEWAVKSPNKKSGNSGGLRKEAVSFEQW